MRWASTAATVWLLLSPCLLGAAEPVALPLRLRLEWTSPTPRVWQGEVRVSSGGCEQPTSLGTAADDATTVRSEQGILRIQRTTAHSYDGLDVTVSAPASAELIVALTADHVTDSPAIRIPLGELFHGRKTLNLADDARITIGRAPGDALQIQVDRPHLVFATGEQLSATVVPQLRGELPVRTIGTLEWQLRPARSDVVLEEGRASMEYRANDPAPQSIPLELMLPEREGVYELRVRLTAPGIVAEESAMQFVVLSSTADRSRLLLGPEHRTLVDEFTPSNAAPPRRFDPQIVNSLRQTTDERTIGPLETSNDTSPRREQGVGDSFPPRSRCGLVSEALTTSAEGGDTANPVRNQHWQAFWLHVEQSRRPHLLVITAPGSVSQQVGISLLEPNAAGQLAPPGLETGFYHLSSGPSASAAPVRHEVTWWPKQRDCLLLLHDLGTGRPIEIEKVELYELTAAADQTPTTSATPTGRWVGPYLHKPLLAETFGGIECLDSPTQRSLKDWLTFHDAGQRLVEYLCSHGHNSTLLTVFADGSALYPSSLLEPTPLYDSGTHFSTGQDIRRKDVLELLYRLFDRAGLVLIPELQFSTPLPALERSIAEQSAPAKGIELIGRDGRTWRESRSSGGTGPIYNPLHPAVQAAVLDVVRELAERYRGHASYQGVAVELSSVGYLQLPGLNWGYDDETVSRFERSTGIRVPAADGPERFHLRYAFLTGRARNEWVRWRCRELAAFHRRLAEVVTASKPTARFILAGNRVLRGRQADDDIYEAVKLGSRLEDLLPPKGLDFSLYHDIERLVVLRPDFQSVPRQHLGDALDETINRSRSLDAAFAVPMRGALLYHLPSEYRLEDFDAVSPWQPAYTWLAAQASATGESNRRRISQALAAGDQQVLFDGGWTIPLGQEAATRPIRDLLRSLPATEFRAADIQRQPLVIRRAHADGKTWFYAVNDFAGTVAVELAFSCPATIPCRRLPTNAAVSLQPASEGSRLRFSIGSFGVWACVFDDPSVRLTEVRVTPTPEAVQRLQQRIQHFEQRLAGARREQVSRASVLSNPGFESATPTGKELADWTIDPDASLSWTIDPDKPRSGKLSLRLTGDSSGGRLLSRALPLQQSRYLNLSVWLRSDRPDTDVRLALEATLHGRRQTQSTSVRVDGQWRQYHFRVTDLPPDDLEQPRISIEPRVGTVWLDDVTLQLQPASPDDVRQLTKVLSSLTIAWQEGRYADCQRLLDSYWGQYLLADEPLPATAEPPNATPRR